MGHKGKRSFLSFCALITAQYLLENAKCQLFTQASPPLVVIKSFSITKQTNLLLLHMGIYCMHGNINPTILVYFKLEACASIKVYLNIILYYICPPQLENYHRHHPYNCGTFLFIPDTSQISVMAQWQYVLLGMIKGLMGDHSCLVPILPQCSCSSFPYDEKKKKTTFGPDSGIQPSKLQLF